MSDNPVPTGDDLTDDDVALLFDIGEYAHDEEKPERAGRVASLMERGYVTCSHADMAALGARFMLTGKGQDTLSARGASLNEA
ncbi:MAG: hypothetical protein JSR61_21235 [Proteobacteria bacterium]|nr:hypothetical protein [Pseudomonadota bacterium]